MKIPIWVINVQLFSYIRTEWQGINDGEYELLLIKDKVRNNGKLKINEIMVLTITWIHTTEKTDKTIRVKQPNKKGSTIYK